MAAEGGKSALVICRTPFQGFMLEQVLEREGVTSYDLVYLTQNAASVEDRNYFERLAKNSHNARYLYIRPRRIDLLNHLLFAWACRGLYRDQKKDIVLLASFDSYPLNAITVRQKGSERVTFDDGSGNFFKHSLYHMKHLSGRAGFYRMLFGAKSMQDFRNGIARHYTSRGQGHNIVEPARRVVIDFGFSRMAAPRNGHVAIFIGGPIVGHRTDDKIERIRAFLRLEEIDHYIPHPRETERVLEEIPVLPKNGQIAEEVVVEAARGKNLTLIAYQSSVLFNFSGDFVRRILILFKDEPNLETWTQFGWESGCEVAVI